MNETKQRTIPVADNGRMNLPADMRRALGLQGSGYLIATLVNDEVHITTASKALQRVRELAAPYKPLDERASDALVAERRNEAWREEHKANPHG